MLRGAIAFFLFLQRPAFDVASLKPSPVTLADRININLGTVRHGELTLGNATLSECIRFAYGLVSEDQLEGPAWIKDRTVRFDVDAKAPPDTPRDRALLMLQSLLDDRFKLVTHREPRKINHYALVVAKGGPKMPAHPAPQQAFGRDRLVYNQVTMETFSMLLSRALRETVLDTTGLKGTFNVRLQWALETPAADQPSGPTIFTAIQEQLGLKLEPSKDPIEVLVVDHAEKVPVGN